MGYSIIVVCIIVLFILLVGWSAFLSGYSSLKEKKKTRRNFFSMAKDEGFTHKDAERLYNLALKTDPEDPGSLFWSPKKLDLLIFSFVRIVEQSRGEENKANHEFLSRLYGCRKKIERDKKKDHNALINTRQIGDYQELQILIEGAGSFMVNMLDNNDYYMTITQPEDPKFPSDFSWEDRYLSAYFWRKDDAGYLFYSSVLAEVFFQGIAALRINHAAALHRTQKRESIRVKVDIPAYLYIIFDEKNARKPESSPGLKCIVKDFSEGGCAVAIGGGTNREIRVKIQFALKGHPICMPGTVRSAKYDKETRRSLLHIKADPLPLEIRNRILGEVFTILSYQGLESSAVHLDHEAEEIQIFGEKDEVNQSKIRISAI
ncbi:MAG: PilZ domain-containing protein [Spirochaetaceae bacterium]|nr:PilZ domain-containing protein [Spirochaetaceae bacterium]